MHDAFLLIPPLYRHHIPEGSTIKGLYLMPLNIRYVKSQIVHMLHSMEIERGDPDPKLTTRYASSQVPMISNLLKSDNINKVLSFVDDFMFAYKFYPNYEASLQYQWHEVNKMTIYEIAKQIHDEPAMLNDDFYRQGGDDLREESDGENQYSEYGYSAFSMRGGTWHPEDLFMESASNRNQAYWRPVEVRFNPLERGPGNKWTRTCNMWENSQMNKKRCNTWGDGTHPMPVGNSHLDMNNSYIGKGRYPGMHTPTEKINMNCNPFHDTTGDEISTDNQRLISGNYNMWEDLTKRYIEIERNTEDRRTEINRRLPY